VKYSVHAAALVLLASCGMAFAQTESKMPPPQQKKMPQQKAPSHKDPANEPAAKKPQPVAEPKKKSLSVGDPAPAITVDSFVKGDAVASFAAGKVYVVEFWATWCPPCLESIPHLTKVQKDNRDLTVIGVAASERGSGDERLKKLRDFVTKQGDKMDYRVAFDSKRAMSKGWMEAAGQTGIPTAFVVGADGKIAHIGHPLEDTFEPAVKAALAKAAKSAAAPATEASKTPQAPK